MDPIFRRSSFFYVTTLLTYCGLMGRFLITRDWPVCEIIPLFMPVWLSNAALIALVIVIYHRLMLAGVRIKASSEAHL